jgi:excisionase family DNA binding protein
MEPMLSVKQAATALGTSVSTLYRMADEGTVRRLTVRSRTVFERAEVERCIHVPRADAAAMPRGAGIGADGQAKRAVVLLSGGLDSATTLAFAKDQGFSCYAISFRYGQRNVIELEAARAVGEALGVRAHVEVEFDLTSTWSSTTTGWPPPPPAATTPAEGQLVSITIERNADGDPRVLYLSRQRGRARRSRHLGSQPSRARARMGWREPNYRG